MCVCVCVCVCFCVPFLGNLTYNKFLKISFYFFWTQHLLKELL